MVETLEISARTVEEATHRALEHLGVTQDKVEVTVVKEGKTGILGIGGENAVIRVRLLEPLAESMPEDVPSVPGITEDVVVPAGPDSAESSRETLGRILTLMGVRGTVSISPCSGYRDPSGAEPPLILNINVDSPGGLIGRRGQTLACLQYLVRLIVTHQTGEWLPVVIDVEGYKQRRYQSLQVLARNIAEQVKVRKSPFALEPMPAYERRIIHLTLVDHPDVTTQSIGLGDLRKVVVLPRE